MTGNPWPRQTDPAVIRMIRDWWELHPEDTPDRALLDVRVVAQQGDSGRGSLRRETDAYRCDLYRKINAASDGWLETIVPNHDLYWTFLVGFAASKAAPPVPRATDA
jgi:hypothetical protein